MPDGRTMGAVGAVVVDNDGKHVWAVVRCDATARERFGTECLDSELDPVLKFSPDGEVATSFGGGMFIWPHGLAQDAAGNIWVTEAVRGVNLPEGDKRGHQAIKFSPDGTVLMRLGTPGEAGGGPDHLTSPADVAVTDDGTIFVADGHWPEGNNRVAKFAADGTFLAEWGGLGTGPGEFETLHAVALDKRGRVFIADRANNRVQIFTQDGEFVAQWLQFGRPSGIYFDAHDRIYVADSESDDVQNPGFAMGIRIGDAHKGSVNEFVLYPWADPRKTQGDGAEFVAVDAEGNLFAGEPFPRMLRKYVRVWE